MEKKKQGRKSENATKYGEFVCSAYHWLPVEKQKENAERLENVTEDEQNTGK